MRILCVEDDADSRELMTLILEQAGYEVVTASDTGNALELAEQNKFALIILDNWLAPGSGVELCKQIRRFDTHTPIIFLSSAAYKIDAEQAMAAGAQDYITKPADFGALIATIGNLVHSSSPQSVE